MAKPKSARQAEIDRQIAIINAEPGTIAVFKVAKTKQDKAELTADILRAATWRVDTGNLRTATPPMPKGAPIPPNKEFDGPQPPHNVWSTGSGRGYADVMARVRGAANAGPSTSTLFGKQPEGSIVRMMGVAHAPKPTPTPAYHPPLVQPKPTPAKVKPAGANPVYAAAAAAVNARKPTSAARKKL